MRPFISVIVILLVSIVLPGSSPAAVSNDDVEQNLPRIQPPPTGKLYHGIFPANPDGTGDEEIRKQDYLEYTNVIGYKAAFIFFSNNWFNSRKFPRRTARWIWRNDAVPYIRLMLRSNNDQNKEEKLYTVSNILAGKFDLDLKKWARAARKFGHPLLVEYGVECNGSWFSWNGIWNGKGNTSGYGDNSLPDGPERFVAAYRHIIDLMDDQGATNITWVFHVNWADYPKNDWNRFENYYPGDEYIDFLAVSAYGPLTPLEKYGDTFRKMIDSAYPRLTALAPGKPVFVSEFGCTHMGKASEKDSRMQADAWAQAALEDLFSGRWPEIAAFSWWNETWPNDNNKKHDTNMRLQDFPALLDVFKNTLAGNVNKVQTEPVIEN